MIVNPKRVYLPFPADFFDLDEDEQRVVCGHIAQALFEQLGVPDERPSETPNRQGS